MTELTFEITNINAERTPEGKVELFARCLQDDMKLKLLLKGPQLNDKVEIRALLLNEHTKRLELKSRLQIGDII